MINSKYFIDKRSYKQFKSLQHLANVIARNFGTTNATHVIPGIHYRIVYYKPAGMIIDISSKFRSMTEFSHNKDSQYWTRHKRVCIVTVPSMVYKYWKFRELLKT